MQFVIACEQDAGVCQAQAGPGTWTEHYRRRAYKTCGFVRDRHSGLHSRIPPPIIYLLCLVLQRVPAVKVPRSSMRAATGSTFEAS